MIRVLEVSINDRAFLGLIKKWLKAGILDISGELIHPALGTPQWENCISDFSERVSSKRT
jgi:hypothetical protein